MFGYVPRSKVQELAQCYETLLRMHDYRQKFPQAWLATNARIGDLRQELKINSERPE